MIQDVRDVADAARLDLLDDAQGEVVVLAALEALPKPADAAAPGRSDRRRGG